MPQRCDRTGQFYSDNLPTRSECMDNHCDKRSIPSSPIFLDNAGEILTLPVKLVSRRKKRAQGNRNNNIQILPVSTYIVRSHVGFPSLITLGCSKPQIAHWRRRIGNPQIFSHVRTLRCPVASDWPIRRRDSEFRYSPGQDRSEEAQKGQQNVELH